MALPIWALKGRALNKWSKLHGLMLYAGQTASVLFVDNGEPIATMFLRPLVLSKDGRNVMGTFQLSHEKTHIWVVGGYSGGVCGFVVHATLDMVNFLFEHPAGVNHFDVGNRDRVKKLLEQKGATCQKLQSTHSLREESGWRYISERDSLPQPLPQPQEPLPRRRLSQGSLFQPILTGS